MKKWMILKSKLIYKYAIPLFVLIISIQILFLSPKSIQDTDSISEKSQIPVVDHQKSEQLMRGVHLLETRSNGKEWELWAETAFNSKDDGSWTLDKVKIRIYGADNLHYDVTGKMGKIDPKQKNITIDGEVNALTSNGYLLKLENLVYDSEKKVMNSSSPVKLLGPSLKGESRLELTGLGMNGNMETNEVRILKDINAFKTLKSGKLLNLKSQSAMINSKNFRAEFIENLIVDYGAFRISGNKGVLDVDNKTQLVQKVSVLGNVKLSDISRLALSDQVIMFVTEKKVVMNGNPRLIQNNNELSGEEITFFEESAHIQIKRAKAKFDKNLAPLQD